MTGYVKWGLIGVLLLALVAAAWSAVQRFKVEQANRQVEVVVQYNQLHDLAVETGAPLPEVLRSLRQHGLTGVLFKEDNVASLTPQAWIEPGYRLLVNPLFTQRFGNQLEPEANYIVMRDAALYQRVAANLNAKLTRITVLAAPEANLYLAGGRWSPQALERVGLGFDRQAMDLVTAAGLDLAVQLYSWDNTRVEAWDTVFRPLEQYANMTTVLFMEYTIPGYPDKLHRLSQEIAKLNANIGIIEFSPQRGLDQLVRLRQKQAVRLHSLPANWVASHSPAEAVDRLALSASERNNRVLFTRIFLGVDKEEWLAVNQAYLEQLQLRLIREGFTLGPAHPYGTLPLGRGPVLLSGLGVLAGAVLLFLRMGMGRLSLALGALGLMAWLAGLWVLDLSLARKAMALAATLVFPTLAVLMAQRPGASTPWRAVRLLWQTAAVSLAGALLVVGLLADLGFVLNIDQFAGVKLAHTLPLILLGLVAAWPLFDWRQWQRSLVKLLQQPVRVGWVILALTVLVIGYVLITRTGNEGVAVTQPELILRGLLDKWLVVRPRTKEFMIGHPVLLLAIFLGMRYRYLPLWLLGAIGQVSLINTFAHVHTPLAISLLRTFNGLWLGTLGGLVLIGLVSWIRRRWPVEAIQRD